MNLYLYLAIFLAVDLLLVIYVVYRRSKKRFSSGEIRFFHAQWKKISGLSDPKHAILDADKLLHAVLQKKGYSGNVGDQLKRAGKLFSDVNAVWYAHKLRNRIAHELDMKLTEAERHRALRSYEKVLKDLGAL